MICDTCKTPILPNQGLAGIGTCEADQTFGHGYQLTCIAALLDENAELRKDRARLDAVINALLRGALDIMRVGNALYLRTVHAGQAGKYLAKGEDANWMIAGRAAIDAAMKEGK
jgi:hypothetical protein